MPAPPAFGTADYAAAMARLLPKGRVWRTDSAAGWPQVLLALAPTYTRSTAAAAQVLVDANPDTTQNLLVEWEESLGLPDPCTPLNPTLQQRAAAVAAKFGARGSLTIAYLVGLAAAFGYAISITEFAPFRVGFNTVGSPLYGTPWAFAWQVNAPTIGVGYFRVGEDAVGEPLSWWTNANLQCEMGRAAPLGTVILYNFAPALSLDSGVLCVASSPDWPESPIGLPAGAVWSNGTVVCVIPGVTPNPLAPAMFYGTVTSTELLATGGGDLPLADPHELGQLWNNVNVVCVSLG